MFIDEATIKVIGGKGGDGNVSFFPGMKSGPSGGDGGHGGGVYVKGDPNKVDLYQFVSRKKYIAEAGERGDKFRKEGADGADLILTVPIGTLFKNTETGEEIEINDSETMYVLAKGGRGGRGNTAFTTSTYQAPRKAEPGFKGQERDYKVILRLIADIGLIGLPNAGKSSLLNELTAAKARIGAYPFTTLEPNLGAWGRYIIADIPGLIEGASEGKGLGIRFLKHIEKVKIIIHCIALDSADIMTDYSTVISEMKSYNEELLTKKQIILLTKNDLVSKDDLQKKLNEIKKIVSDAPVKTISIYDPDGFVEFQKYLQGFVSK
jgi:GTP-binding protein